jgi:hypothetical protein
MANTFVKLSSVTVGAGGASTISFSNIPQSYTDLKVVLSTRRSAANVWGTYLLTVNGDNLNAVGISYGQTYGQGTGSSFSHNGRFAASMVASEGVGSGSTADVFDNAEITLADYCNNKNLKNIQTEAVGENQATTAYSIFGTLNILATDPINSVTFTSGSGNFVEHSNAILYGVFNADVSAVPSAPTIGTATAGSAQASITFTGVANAASYTMTSTPGNITGSGAISPIVVSGLTANTAYTFKVKANNPFGSSAESAASNSVTPVGAGVFESIATIGVGSAGATSVTFSSIPSDYTHLQLRIYSKCNSAGAALDEIALTFNGDTGTNYSWHFVYGGNNSVNNGNAATAAFIRCAFTPRAGAQAYAFAGYVIDIADYANTNKNKTIKSLGGVDLNNTSTASAVGIKSGVWRSNSAITSLSLKPEGSSSFVHYSHFALYGIRTS